MVGLGTGIFRCVLLMPEGSLLDCKASAVSLPGHDGSLGILRNHAPMLCKLGMGIMAVRDIAGREDAFFFIDGGFARVSENSLTVLAYDVVSFEHMEDAEIEDLVSKARETVVGQAYIRQQKDQQMTHERAKLLVKLAELTGIDEKKKARKGN